MRGLVWFKKDLRLIDNPALSAACAQCTDGVIAVYIIDKKMWQAHAASHWQIDFILRGLLALRADLASINIPLHVSEVSSTQAIPLFLQQCAEQNSVQKLFFNRELELNEMRRDQAVMQYCARYGIQSAAYDDQCILSADKVRTQTGGFFKVFTPFKRQWLHIFAQQESLKILAKPKAQAKIKAIFPAESSDLQSLDHSEVIWAAGEKIAQQKLTAFIKKNLFKYDQQRDFPFLDATSKLSPYLAVGMISAKTCFLTALTANEEELDTGNSGALTWMNELIWREFYRHVLVAVPQICMHRAYQAATEKLSWRNDEKLFLAWQQGKTGFPLVDAAMRQLNAIGWMHNRLRMVVAMFLSKNLFLDWRLGEKYFMENLIDGDFASNNGGWQWSASTGTDAVPYFRIFNPTLQSQRFDPEGKFIRYYCPELSTLDARSIHEPHRYQNKLTSAINYPSPIINYVESRAFAINAYKNILSQ